MATHRGGRRSGCGQAHRELDAFRSSPAAACRLSRWAGRCIAASMGGCCTVSLFRDEGNRGWRFSRGPVKSLSSFIILHTWDETLSLEGSLGCRSSWCIYNTCTIPSRGKWFVETHPGATPDHLKARVLLEMLVCRATVASTVGSRRGVILILLSTHRTSCIVHRRCSRWE